MSKLNLDVSDGVAVVTLNDPDRHNVLSQAMVAEMADAFDRIEASADIGAVVLTGLGRSFCAGADLSELGGTRGDGLRAIYEGFLRVARCPVATLAAVNGSAVGAGMNLALACDVRLAGTGARFDTRFLRLGIHPGGGHTWLLEREIGRQMTASAVLFGEVFDAAEAERIGLVARVVSDDELLETAFALARRAAEVPPELTRRAKATINAMQTIRHHDDAIEVELEAQVWSMQRPSFTEGLAAAKRRIGRE